MHIYIYHVLKRILLIVANSWSNYIMQKYSCLIVQYTPECIVKYENNAKASKIMLNIRFFNPFYIAKTQAIILKNVQDENLIIFLFS